MPEIQIKCAHTLSLSLLIPIASSWVFVFLGFLCQSFPCFFLSLCCFSPFFHFFSRFPSRLVNVCPIFLCFSFLLFVLWTDNLQEEEEDSWAWLLAHLHHQQTICCFVSLVALECHFLNENLLTECVSVCRCTSRFVERQICQRSDTWIDFLWTAFVPIHWQFALLLFVGSDSLVFHLFSAIRSNLPALERFKAARWILLCLPWRRPQSFRALSWYFQLISFSSCFSCFSFSNPFFYCLCVQEFRTWQESIWVVFVSFSQNCAFVRSASFPGSRSPLFCLSVQRFCFFFQLLLSFLFDFIFAFVPVILL